MKKLLSQIRITEVGDTAHRLVSLYKSTAALKDEAFLKPLFVEMEEKGNALTEAVRSDAVISQLENADAKRDGAIRVLDKLAIQRLQNHSFGYPKSLWSTAFSGL